MSTFEERDKAWDDLFEAINEYVENATDIEIARRGFKDSSSSVFKMGKILDFADETVCDQFERRLEQDMVIINRTLLPTYITFAYWVRTHQDLIEEKESSDGKYKEIYYKPDGSLISCLDKDRVTLSGERILEKEQ